MTATIPSPELPKGLQAMIADAQVAIANWDADEDANDPDFQFVGQFMRDWTLRLSQGQYDDELYWECVADDLEEAGDWRGAVSAYRRILDLPSASLTEHCKAHASIAAIQRMLGEDNAALESFRNATRKAREFHLLLWRRYVRSEISQLLRMGFVRRARSLVRKGFAAHEPETNDHLGIAQLLILSAQCDLARGRPAEAAKSSQLAWDWLDVLVQDVLSVREDGLRDASGVHRTYANWWCTEAKRHRLAGEGASEIDALSNAIERARLCFDRDGWRAHWDDLALMHILLQIADAYDRHGQKANAEVARTEAEEIRARRKFPLSCDALEIRPRSPLLIRITNTARLWWQSLLARKK